MFTANCAAKARRYAGLASPRATYAREIAFLVSRDLAERMDRQMRGFLHRAERNEPDLLRLARPFEGPANARVASEPLAAIRRTLEGGEGDRRGECAREGSGGDGWDRTTDLRVMNPPL